MQNVVFVLWPNSESTRNKVPRQSVLLGPVKERLLELEPVELRFGIDDQFVQVKSPAPKLYPGEAMVALIVFKAMQVPINDIEKLLLNHGFTVGSYLTDASLYTDYGDNQHFRCRDWGNGERSPTVLMTTLLTRPKKLVHAEWLRRWHGDMSRVSDQIQPRARYMRHVVLEKSSNSPAFDGIVEEVWPSNAHVKDPYKFYLANNPLQLVWHMLRMLHVVSRFHQMRKIRTVMLSEYFIAGPEPAITSGSAEAEAIS